MFAESAATDGVKPAPARVDVSVGVIGAATAVCLACGAAAAKLLVAAHPRASILFAPIVCGGLYALIRIAARSDASPSVRLVVSCSAVAFVVAYGVVLAGETYRPAHTPDHIGRFIVGLILLARILLAASVAPVIASVAIWRAMDRGRRPRFGNLAPLMISLGMAATAFGLVMTAMLASFALLPRSASFYGLAATAVLLPSAIVPIWTTIYAYLLARWEVERVPEPLTMALARLRARCGFRFDRVICLVADYGNGRIAAVTSSPRTATLLISEPLVESLGPDELLAVLAHETAHVELHHARRKAAFGVLATLAFCCASGIVFVVARFVAPHGMEIVAAMMTGGLLGLGRSLYDSRVTRRHEREADEYAARAVSAEALLTALEKLGAGSQTVVAANRWTTHSSWVIRSGRLRELAAGERDLQRASARDDAAGSSSPVGR